MPKVSDAYRDARRRAILDAAITCFERRGLHGTTTDDIAAEAGLSNGALYRYFDGKAAIIEAIAAERHAQERALLDAALQRRATRVARCTTSSPRTSPGSPIPTSCAGDG